MTFIVIDPKNIHNLFPRANVSNPIRIRIVAQVLEFNLFDTKLTIQRLPSLSSDQVEDDQAESDNESDDSIIIIDEPEEPKLKEVQDTSTTLDLSEIESQLSVSTLTSGNILNIDAFYDGQGINVFQISEIDPRIVRSERFLRTLKYLSDRELMKPIRQWD
ncbi:hypothetical protein KGF54_003979 [Candida jiufengensis]|uniref:uncharacterized protein n=1 Tax=Candida jiufengensis TaxID=497108 RepID=UPI0022240B66|nr:uncharacterized protein KGF54_003979 [Candida jiufengensis]KAI5950905.1 hypothetical protein KGF54_003979 [Candida jiufengensis]